MDMENLKATLTCRLSTATHHYKLVIADETVHEIDVENMIRIIEIADQLAEIVPRPPGIPETPQCLTRDAALLSNLTRCGALTRGASRRSRDRRS